MASELGLATMRSVRIRLLPFLFVLYVVSFLDRVNVGFAALEMNRDLALGPTVFGFAAGIFFIGYALCEVPSNLILARVGARVWIARIMVTWGLIAAGMMFVRGPLSLYTLRFLLGVAEGGFFPGIVFYLSQWFPADMRARVVARFMMAIPVSGIVGGPISGALLGLKGHLGLAGWQWLFILEGLPAVILGVAVFFYLPEKPTEARWLAPDQRGWLTARLASEEDRRLAQHRYSVRQALLNPIVWQLGLLILLGASIGGYALTLWLPQIVRSSATLTNLQIGLLTAVPNIVAVMFMLLIAAHSDRTGERCLHFAAAAGIAIVGFVGSALATSPWVALVFLSLALAGWLGGNVVFWPLPSKFLNGAAAAGGIALINSINSLSGFVGPYAVGLLTGLTGNIRSALLWVALAPFVGALLALRLQHAPLLHAK